MTDNVIDVPVRQGLLERVLRLIGRCGFPGSNGAAMAIEDQRRAREGSPGER